MYVWNHAVEYVQHFDPPFKVYSYTLCNISLTLHKMTSDTLHKRQNTNNICTLTLMYILYTLHILYFSTILYSLHMLYFSTILYIYLSTILYSILVLY